MGLRQMVPWWLSCGLLFSSCGGVELPAPALVMQSTLEQEVAVVADGQKIKIELHDKKDIGGFALPTHDRIVLDRKAVCEMTAPEKDGWYVAGKILGGLVAGWLTISEIGDN